MTDMNARVADAHRRIDHVEKILDNHGAHLEQLASSIKENTSSLAENTRLTQQIADNTSEMVDIFKGAKAFRRFFIWSAGIATAATAFIAIVTTVWQWFNGR